MLKATDFFFTPSSVFHRITEEKFEVPGAQERQGRRYLSACEKEKPSVDPFLSLRDT